MKADVNLVIQSGEVGLAVQIRFHEKLPHVWLQPHQNFYSGLMLIPQPHYEPGVYKVSSQKTNAGFISRLILPYKYSGCFIETPTKSTTVEATVGDDGIIFDPLDFGKMESRIPIRKVGKGRKVVGQGNGNKFHEIKAALDHLNSFLGTMKGGTLTFIVEKGGHVEADWTPDQPQKIRLG